MTELVKSTVHLIGGPCDGDQLEVFPMVRWIELPSRFEEGRLACGVYARIGDIALWGGTDKWTAVWRTMG